MLAMVAQAGADVADARAVQHTHGRVAQQGHDRRPLALMDQALVLAQREGSTVAAVLRHLATERLEQLRAVGPQDRRAERLEFADAHDAYRASASITIQGRPGPRTTMRVAEHLRHPCQ